MGRVEKGVVLSLEGANAARVQCTSAQGTSSLPLTIPIDLRGQLSKGTEVAYVIFDDATGVILSRMDGENRAPEQGGA